MVKKNKKEDEEKIVYYTSFVEDGNKIYEQIKGDKYIDKDGKLYSELEIGGVNFRPIHAEEVDREVVLLPNKLENYEDIPILIEEIKTFIHKYYDFEKHHLLFASWYVLLTWVYDRLNTINYLRALGDFGTGKTRFKETIGRICYKPILGSGAGSIAALKRMPNKIAVGTAEYSRYLSASPRNLIGLIKFTRAATTKRPIAHTKRKS